jgi:hypothetical protein
MTRLLAKVLVKRCLKGLKTQRTGVLLFTNQETPSCNLNYNVFSISIFQALKDLGLICVTEIADILGLLIERREHCIIVNPVADQVSHLLCIKSRVAHWEFLKRIRKRILLG